MARKKKVVEQFVVGSALELYGNLMSDAVSFSPEEAVEQAVEYQGDPSYVEGYIVFKLVPVARVQIPPTPQFTLEPIS